MNRRLLLPRESGLFRYAELWLDGAEILYVNSSRFSERYSRFQIADIQALVVTEFALWNPLRSASLGLSFFFTLLLLILAPGAWAWWAVVPGIWLVFALFDVARGPRCRLVLHTAVSTVTIEAARTMKQANQAVPVLRALITSVQGELSRDGMTITPPIRSAGDVPVVKNTPLLQRVLFGMLVAHAGILAALFFAKQMENGLGLSFTLLAAEIVMGVIAFNRRREVGIWVAALSMVTAILATVDAGVLGFSMTKSWIEFFRAVDRGGVRPENIEWLWLREQTVARAIWHAVVGLSGWVAWLINKEPDAE
ncbi:MAG: hypothetical protein FJW38_08060 [Acidobacteria bacterium]|nr:hypothetical protein [Acidobacteriota bacterium]